jgi:hypothetical protein
MRMLLPDKKAYGNLGKGIDLTNERRRVVCIRDCDPKKLGVLKFQIGDIKHCSLPHS